MPQKDRRKLKKTAEAKANREKQKRFAERHGEAYKAVNRAKAAYHYAKHRLQRAQALLTAKIQREEEQSARCAEEPPKE